MGARETALNALIACRKSGAWSNGVLKEYIQRDRLDPRDAGLATRLCYGVLQNRQKLDFYLKQLLTGKLKDLHPVVRDILHMGLYQIYEMDKIPESAAVNESVDLAKTQMENIMSHRMQILDLSGEQLLQIKVQLVPVLKDTVAKSCCQSRIPAIQPITDHIFFQNSVGPGTILAAGNQRIQRCFPGAHYAFRGWPRK